MTTPEVKAPRGEESAGAPRNAAQVEARNTKHTQPVPIPQAGVDPELLPWRRVRSATAAEIAEVLRIHNLAVLSWNEAERDSTRPLPRIFAAGRWRFMLGLTKRTRGVHACRADGVTIYLRTRGWSPFPSGWTCERRMLARVDVVRADVRVPRLAMEGRGHE